MGEGRTPADRFLDMVDRRIAPALAPFGFVRRPGVLARDAGDVRWLVELELAPWTTPEKICFTLAWGVAVPGLAEVLGDPGGSQERVVACPIRGRVGEGATGLEATWFTVGPVSAFPGFERFVDARTAQSAVQLVQTDLLPPLRPFDSIAAVQAHLVERLVRGRGAAGQGELQRLRWIAGMSLLLDERDNASRWLDYLEVRSSSAIAPDVVAERLSPLRQRCAS